VKAGDNPKPFKGGSVVAKKSEKSSKVDEKGPVKLKVVLGADQLAKLLEDDEVKLTQGEHRLSIQLGDFEGADLDDLGVAAQALATLIDDLEEDESEAGDPGDSTSENEAVEDEDSEEEGEEEKLNGKGSQ
jgi:hypothetical protein